MKNIVIIMVVILSSCSTYKKTEVVNEWKTTYDMVFTVERVEIYDKKTDTLRRTRMDTTVLDITEWRHKKYFKQFDN